jgi:hypothetical protein
MMLKKVFKDLSGYRPPRNINSPVEKSPKKSKNANSLIPENLQIRLDRNKINLNDAPGLLTEFFDLD